MLIFTNIDEIKSYLKEKKKLGKTVGLVPTMGFLHKGHRFLINNAKGENDIVVVSIFVNPTQFGMGEDFDKYPRNLANDQLLAAEAGADLIFAPSIEEMYPKGYQTFIEVNDLTKTLCGKSRPTHFRGVTTVVSKLFNIINPNKAYFGQKDAQQVIVIKRMVKDLNMDIDIVICPIIREADGLAMSSRNVYLSKEAREQATALSYSLNSARELIIKGERDAEIIKNNIIKIIKQKPLANIDYVSIVDTETLYDVEHIDGTILIALAVKFVETRLIDNIIVEVEKSNVN